MLFLCTVLLAGIRDRRLERKTCREGKIRTQRVAQGLIGKDPDAGRDWGQEEKGTTEDETAGWHY